MLLQIALILVATPTPPPPLSFQQLRVRRVGSVPGGGVCRGSGSPSSGAGRNSGPGDTVPSAPASSSPSPSSPGPSAVAPKSPGPRGPSTPGAGPTAANSPATGGRDNELNTWARWWRYNREEFLLAGPRWTLPESGPSPARGIQAPSPALIHEQVVPALRALLASDPGPDVTAGTLLSLARIGTARPGDASIAKLLSAHLGDAHRGVAESACLALGILAEDRTVPTLAALVSDTEEARVLCGERQVPDRMRAFAAYGLGLSSQRSANPDVRRFATATLLRTLESSVKTRSVRVSAAIGLGLCAPDGHGVSGVKPRATPSSSNSELTKRLLALFEDEESDDLVRTHLATAIGRLASQSAPGVRKAAIDSLLKSLARSSRERNEVRQSCALALGALADADLERLDREARDGLMNAATGGDLTTRHFALLSLGKIASRAGDSPEEALAASPKIRAFLFSRLAKSSNETRTWAALAIGIAGFGLRDTLGLSPEEVGALRLALDENRSSDRRAVLALATGLAGDESAANAVLSSLEGHAQDEGFARYAALGLGFGGSRAAIDPLHGLLRSARHRPELLEDTALALRSLGDEELVNELTAMIDDCGCALSQASAASALGRTRDARAVKPLLALISDPTGPRSKRAWAAIALGELCDAFELPWHAVIGAGLNYLTDEPTLTDTTGGGVLDYL